MDTQKDWVDFRAIKQAVAMIAVLDRYGINWLRKKDDELRGRCPLHQGEGERSFHVNTTKNVYYCFSCKSRGNVLDFVKAMQEATTGETITVREAALLLKEWFAVGESSAALSAPINAAEQPVAEASESSLKLVNPPLSFQLRVDPDCEYGFGRGLTKDIMEYFGAGRCLSKGAFSGRFVIPLHNERGELVGYAGRSLDDAEPKYLFPSKDKGFHKSHLLFNLHRVIGPEWTDAQPAILTEGFFAPMKFLNAGFRCLASLGASLSQVQEKLLVRHFKRVLLLFDGDHAGRQCTDDCLVRLGRKLWVRALDLAPGQQPDHLSTDDLAALLKSAHV
jgi:DNA primase